MRRSLDDPTRLWRLARYAARLGSTSMTTPASWPRRPTRRRSAGHGWAPSCASRSAEPDPVAALRAARELNPALLPAGFAPGRRRRRAGAAGRRRPHDLVILAASVAGMDVGALLAWLDASRSRPTTATSSPRPRGPSTGAPLHAARTPSQIARAARGAPIEAVALAGGRQRAALAGRAAPRALQIDGTRPARRRGSPRARTSAPACSARSTACSTARSSPPATPSSPRRSRGAAMADPRLPAPFTWTGDHIASTSAPRACASRRAAAACRPGRTHR